jgi:hypothetical protein
MSSSSTICTASRMRWSPPRSRLVNPCAVQLHLPAFRFAALDPYTWPPARK